MMKIQLITTLTAAIFASTAWGAEVEARFQAGALSFAGGTSYTNATLEITGPKDFEVTQTASRGMPVFRLSSGKISDGFYQYSLSAATDIKVKLTSKLNNGRDDKARDYVFKPFYLSGIFQVERGRIVEPAKDSVADRDQVEK